MLITLKIIPNIFTLLNLFCGCISIIFLQYKNFNHSAVFTLFSIIFDLLDGLFSRLIKNKNPFGKELDSLADMVSFGLVPSIIVFILLKKITPIPFIEYSAFFISIISAWRLAKFNITPNNNYVVGLTTPVNALFFSSLSVIITNHAIFFSNKKIIYFITMLFMIFFSCYFLISKITMFSLNFENFSWKKNKMRYFFLLISTFLLLTLHVIALPCIIVFYIITSIYFHKKLKQKNSY
ncbi:phosphatidylcholine/phosphatidylserine synthase [Blattabacterium sp. (Blaberus giganteus)]|uniref:CDP-alcohol phosphatidyltransferase family protein n=1 Tax=Blattabacterium sp. (Blaberus giganteus) TaxID=1186051 RepID=UPI00025F6E62|nr:CDP-alcohol phosphatidyltransferase family protein [Blattabacterium sp. (Blaberus giganteus)]AFJ90561.1 CDP-diacylglycerol--serine O-phosphatidyltransferase [Blattabacterium sp. (Blaberus giganteus)]